MTIETYLVNYLTGALTNIPVSGSAPRSKPAKFVTLEKTGERVVNFIPKATVAVQSWALTRADAMALNEDVKAAMAAILAQPEIMSCKLNSDYNYPYQASNRPRYQAVFEIVYDHNISA